MKLINFFIFSILLKQICFSQVSIQEIKNPDNELDSNYIKKMINENGWKHYANYYFCCDSLWVNEKIEDCTIRLTKDGEFLTILNDGFIGHGKYKIKNDIIYLKAAKELKRTNRIKKRKWGQQKIIVVSEKLMIFESISNDEKIRHVYIKS